MSIATWKHPAAFLPVAMSAAATALLAGYLAVYGVTHEPDEGTAAHLWQLLMAGQLPIIFFYAVLWLPRNLRQALEVLAVQVTAAAVSMALLYWAEHFA